MGSRRRPASWYVFLSCASLPWTQVWLTTAQAEKADFKANKPRAQPPARMAISLDSREQSLLYCELEFILSNALDTYIKTQLNGGRLDPDKLKKVADAWASKGRPRVVGFRYDLEMQVELVHLHQRQFRFYGRLAQADGEGAVLGLLHAMKVNARSMRVRTLCQPDSVIVKHILDAQALLVLLGSQEGLRRGLAEVSQFFRVILERERAARERREASIQAVPPEQFDFPWKTAQKVSATSNEQRCQWPPQEQDDPSVMTLPAAVWDGKDERRFQDN